MVRPNAYVVISCGGGEVRAELSIEEFRVDLEVDTPAGTVRSGARLGGFPLPLFELLRQGSNHRHHRSPGIGAEALEVVE